MLETITQAVVMLLMVAGLFFFGVATIGLLRLPDVYTRLHATTKSDSLGAVLLLAGLAIYGGLELNTLKLVGIIAFVWLTTPTASHLVGKAAYRTGVTPHAGEFKIIDFTDHKPDSEED